MNNTNYLIICHSPAHYRLLANLASRPFPPSHRLWSLQPEATLEVAGGGD